jgi:hypothetical protein
MREERARILLRVSRSAPLKAIVSPQIRDRFMTLGAHLERLETSPQGHRLKKTGAV